MLALVLPAGLPSVRDADAARTLLVQTLQDANRVGPALLALQSTGEKELAPLFAAQLRSPNKRRRLFAAAALCNVAGKAAAGALRERLWRDDEPAVRAEALVRLIALEAVSVKDLQKALSMDNESVQCIAARELTQRKRGDLARPVLARLTESKTLTTASLSRMSLLGLGQKQQLPILRKTLARPDAGRVTELLLGQIREEKIAAARELAEHVAAHATTSWVRVQAWWAICAVAPNAPALLAGAIRKSTNPVLRVQLFETLALREDGAATVRAFSRGDDAIAALARFELARAKGGPAGAKAAAEVIRLGHPILADYVLGRAARDVAKSRDKAGFYAGPLLALIRSADPNASRMGRAHISAARAATVLCDLGTGEARKGLRALLAGPYGPRHRIVARGLLHAKTDRSIDLAVPLLKSPYATIVTEAALALGRFGRPVAAEALADIVRHPGRHRTDVVVHACWYRLRIAKQIGPTVRALVQAVAPPSD